MAQKRSRPKSEAEMAPLVAAWRRGEGTQAEVAARAGMPASTFAWWCQRIPAADDNKPAFVPVAVRPEPCAASAFELVLGAGRVLRVPPGFAAADLRALLDVLEAAC